MHNLNIYSKKYFMNKDDIFKTLLDSVPNGGFKRFDCPFCHGKNTLSISKIMGQAMYNCYKNSCNFKGSRYIRLSENELKVIMEARKDIKNDVNSKTSLETRTRAKTPFSIPDHWIKGIGCKKAFQMLLNSNALEAYQSGLCQLAYDPKQDRLVYLIEDNTGAIIGGIGRALSGQAPKVYNYNTKEDTPFVCGIEGNIGVLVEDCASACSIARIKGYTGIALLGTHCKLSYMYYIIANFSKIIIALDPDAYAKSLKLSNSLGYYSDNVSTWKLTKELKDMTKLEIQDFIFKQKVNSTII